MIAGIKECHIKKFSRLVQELEQLRLDIKEYCPDVVFRLNNTSTMELGIDKGFEDYPYIIAEDLICDSINDVGTESYCLVGEDSEKQLAYHKTKSKSNRVKIGSDRYMDEVYPYWNGYKNTRGTMTQKEFALSCLGIELYE